MGIDDGHLLRAGHGKKSRRRLFGTLTGWATACLWLRSAEAWSATSAARSTTGVTPAALFSRPRSARSVGRVLLKAGVNAAEAFGLDFVDAAARTPEPEALRRRFAQNVRADFAAGRTVRVAGWTLSRTEAQLCIRVARDWPDETVERR